VPRDLLCFGYQLEAGGSQHRGMQDLADVAGCFRTAGVLVEKGAARSEVQQGNASQDRQRSPTIALSRE
jgi:hypothetical protein